MVTPYGEGSMANGEASISRATSLVDSSGVKSDYVALPSSESTAVILYDASNNGIISTSPNNAPSRRFVGLLNQGATCYMNSLLQSLYMTPEFRVAIYKWKYNPEKDGDAEMCIPLQLQKLFGLLQLSKSNAISTVALTKSFGWDSNEVFQQQDVQELCRKLMEALEDAFKNTAEEKVIDELFSGELIDYIKCIDIEHESEKRDKFLDFSLAIKPFDSDVIMHSLSECIESYLKPELLDGDNMVHVESVEKKVPAIKGLKIGKLPLVMSIHLKRFVFDFTGPTIIQKKLNDQVRFPVLLDMNKYVAARKKSTKDNLEGGALQRLDSVEGNEFEMFLKEQIQVLRAKKEPEEEPVVDVDMTDPTVPDLVDYNGKLSPEQMKENEIIYSEEVEISSETVAQMLLTRGEWIYELYAVLIHSGASSGGHYYAYIKDLDDDSWWNFNDSSVSPIDKTKVCEAWGGKNRSASSSSNKYAWSSGLSSMNMSNAYMLYYRKVSADGKYAKFPDEKDIPLHVKELVEQHDREQAQRDQEEEERRNILKLRIHWKKVEMEVLCKRSQTYNELLMQLWNDFNLQSEYDGEENLNPLELIRLRRFSTYNSTPLQAIDVKQNGTVKLLNLSLNEYAPFYLDSRKTGEKFEDFDEGGMTLTIVEVNAAEDGFEEPRSLRLKKNATAQDVLVAISGWSGLAFDDIRLVRFNVAYDKQTPEIISAEPTKRLKDDLNIYESQKLYYEKDSKKPIEESGLYQAFMLLVNMVTIKINVPPSAEINRCINLDRRITPGQLRELVAKECGRPPADIYMFRSYSRGIEIKDSSESIYQLGIHHSVFVDYYPAPPVGEFRLQAFLVPQDYKPGFISLDQVCSHLVAVETDLQSSSDLVPSIPPATDTENNSLALNLSFDINDFDIFQTESSGNSHIATEFSIAKVGVHIKYTSDSLIGLDTIGYSITADTPVIDVKTTLLRLFISSGRLPPEATTAWVRLWEKLGSHKGKHLKYDQKSLLANGFAVCDWRHMYVQLLDADYTPANYKETDVVLLVQRFRRSTWTMSPMVEVAISTEMSIGVLFDTLASVSGIDVTNLKVLVLFSYSEINLCGLDDDSYLFSKNLRWFRKPEENHEQSVFSWYSQLNHSHLKSEFADGTLLLIQDVTEPLRELKPDEKASQQKILEGDTFFNPSLFSSSYSGASAVMYRNGGRVEKGIHIKSRNEKEGGEATSSSPSLEQKNDSNGDGTKFDIF